MTAGDSKDPGKTASRPAKPATAGPVETAASALSGTEKARSARGKIPPAAAAPSLAIPGKPRPAGDSKSAPETVPPQPAPKDGAAPADADKGPPTAGQKTTPRITPNGEPTVLAVVIGTVFWIVIGLILAFNYFDILKPELELAAAVSESDSGQEWLLTGHVIYDGDFVEGANVWSISTDRRGNAVSSGNTRTDANGKFTAPPIPKMIGGHKDQLITEIRVNAKWNRPEENATPQPDGTYKLEDLRRKSSYKAKYLIGVGKTERYQVIRLPGAELLVLAFIFALSVLIALVPVPGGDNEKTWLVLKYFTSVLLAFSFTTFMVLYLSLGLRHINLTASGVDNEVLSLGFANVFRGRYVPGAEEEWLLSLTTPRVAPAEPAEAPPTPPPSPPVTVAEGPAEGASESDESVAVEPEPSPGVTDAPAAAPDPPLQKGFGAPLWTLLLAVIGAGLFTIDIIVDGAKQAPLSLTADQLRSRVQSIIVHQFYVFFAPLGAIFVYQFLVAAESASQPVVVALAILAAGVGLKHVLDKARDQMGKTVGDKKG